MKYLLAVSLPLLLVPLAHAAPEDAAARFVDLWNLDGERNARFVEVFSDSFVQKRSPQRLAQMLTMLSSDNGDIEIAEIIDSGPDKIAFTARSVEDKWVEIALNLDADERVAGMQIRRMPAPAKPSDSGLSLDQIVARLESDLATRADAGEFSGAVLLARRGEPLFARAYGLADREQGRANTLDTPINLGSINKMFTGLAITQLVAAGKLDFDATVGTYLPDYPNAVVRDQVTLHQLLTHTSGMGLYWNDAYLAAKDQISDLQGFLATFVDEPLRFPPGSEFGYSNSGPVVLGLIIEAVTGTSYYDYVRQHIYRPAGMTHSDHYAKTEQASGKATGYYVPQGKTAAISNQTDLGNIGSPAGGGYASANDLLRFANALFDGTLIAPEYREVMTTNKLSGAQRNGYGYLYGDAQVNGRRYIGHNGGAPGINAEFSVFPESGITLIVLSNSDHAASPVADQVRQWLGYAKL